MHCSKALVVLGVLAFTGCATANRTLQFPAQPALVDKVLEGSTALREPLELSTSLRTRVVQEVGLDGTDDERVHRLIHWMEGAGGTFQYSAGYTYTANEAFEHRSGDCFSITNLFVALSRQINVSSRYVFVREQPSFSDASGSFIISEHIAAAYGSGTFRQVIDFEKPPQTGLLYMYRDLDDRQAFALFNSNLAMERMFAGERKSPEAILRKLVELAPELPELRSNLVAALLVLEQPREALKVVDEGLKVDASYAPLITNGLEAAYRTGDQQLVRSFEAQGSQLAEEDPLLAYALGMARYRRADYRGAAEGFRRAARQFENPGIWIWLARAHLKAGDTADGIQAYAHVAARAPQDHRVRQLAREFPQLR